MSQIHVEASDVLAARPEQIYAILSDYKEAHLKILPTQYFTQVVVEKGGKGAGTVFTVQVKVMGAVMNYHMVVSEPEAGKVLAETDLDTGLVTTFRLEPLNDGQQTRVTIASDFKASPGFKGVLEKWGSPPVMRRIYKKELKLLAEYAGSQKMGAAAS